MVYLSMTLLFLCSILQINFTLTSAFIRSPLLFLKTRIDDEALILSLPHLEMSDDGEKNNFNSVQLASVEALDGDHELEGSRLSASIAAWLDQEVSFYGEIKTSTVSAGSFTFSTTFFLFSSHNLDFNTLQVDTTGCPQPHWRRSEKRVCRMP
jgi:hypothetical protein